MKDGTVISTANWDDATRMIQGNVHIKNNQGHTFEGTLVNNVRQGLGKYTWPNGEYEGPYLNGERHTQGNEVAKMEWSEGGNIYVGKFVKG